MKISQDRDLILTFIPFKFEENPLIRKKDTALGNFTKLPSDNSETTEEDDRFLKRPFMEIGLKLDMSKR